MRVIYSKDYDLNLGNHVFPSIKYRLIKEKLLRDGIVAAEDIVEPPAASEDDIALVHTRAKVWAVPQIGSTVKSTHSTSAATAPAANGASDRQSRTR